MTNHDKEKTIKSRTLALILMRKHDRYKYAIYNHICEDTGKVATEISELFQRMKAQGIEMRQEANNKGKGY
jgi:hypothetical protein